ncbi:MAG: PD40 domain-containing protein [FCB group bacterium]|nr:PD40 domain-containing protein [FCB group bacterium]MBL7028348.1 PD40 domain-containing protein [Candidatus Neomarinimicrobiota bacterium]MBL7121667.1 PD40 domain-containing protein [Candidatus Neomarinimicrobiota bacterium]
MRKFFLIICIVLFSSLSARESPSPFLEDILQEYPSIRDLTLSKDEAYFTAQSPMGEISAIMVSRKIRNKWRKPEIASFSGSFADLEPFLSVDGKRLYYASNRPLTSDSTTVKDYDLWMVQRDDSKSKWSNPINLGAPVNTGHNEFYPSLTQDGNLYFTSDRPDSKGKDDIFFSARAGKDFTAPISLSDSINTSGYEFNAFIAPDESYLLFSGYNREDGLGSGDLYISFKKEDKTWTRAKNLGEAFNSKYMDYCPFVDTKSQTLYFTSRRSDVEFKAGGFTSVKTLLQELNKSSNGQSRLYKVHFKIPK